MSTKDALVFPEFAARCEEARVALRKHMGDRCLHERDGWRIHEFTREVDGRTEIVMRPVHLHLNEPSDLECVCTIDEPGSKVTSDCST
jgi:hypothetical protein